MIRHAVVTVLAKRQAMVMGPTPPGTGVMAPARSAAAANSDDDNNFIFYVSLIGLVAVASVLLIIRLTVLKKDGEPFRLFGKRKGDK